MQVNMLANASSWLAGKLKAHASSEVEYRRDAETLAVQAVFGKTDYEVQDESGLRIGGFVCDFLIAAADLPWNPEVGDVIAANARKYEVLDLGADGCWRWTDGHQTMRRIHTKDIGSDD